MSILLNCTALSLAVLLAAVPSPAYGAVGDLILAGRIDLTIPDLGGSWEYANNMTLLKEGYVLSLDSVYFESTPATDSLPGKHISIANFSLYKNDEVVKKMSIHEGDVFYYNRTIGSREYTIIESNVQGIYRGTQTILVRLEPFYQYSDGSTVYSLTELRNSTETPIEKISDEDINVVLETVAPKISTFDNNKYEKIKATLKLQYSELIKNVLVDFFFL